jgi:hypothetical protein
MSLRVAPVALTAAVWGAIGMSRRSASRFNPVGILAQDARRFAKAVTTLSVAFRGAKDGSSGN